MQKFKILFISCLFFFGLKVSYAIMPDMQALSALSESIRSCNPGTYSMPIPEGFNVNNVSYQIYGMNAGKCQITVTGSYIKPGETQSANFSLNCSISPDDLSQISRSIVNIPTESLSLTTLMMNPIVSVLKGMCKSN